jgi:hypothetical protein
VTGEARSSCGACRLRIVDSVFTGNRCERDGPDIGGAAVRALSQYRDLPVYVVNSIFSANACSLFLDNHANEGGGAIFFVRDDGTGTMAISGSVLEHNANDGLHTPGLAGIYFPGARRPTITGSVLR